MTINLPTFGIAKSFWPKLFGGVGVATQIIAVSYYTNPTYFIYGLTAFSFWTMISGIANSLALFTVRQDSLSSEQVGAGNVPPVRNIPTLQPWPEVKPPNPPPQHPINPETLQAQIAELQKKLEGK